MASRDAPAPTEFIYISERKLFNLARSLQISTSWFERDVTLEGVGRLAVPLGPGSGLSAQAKTRAERIQPGQRERAIEKLLARVVRSLEREGVADLDTGAGTITDGNWFYFHRRLRFGVGSAEGSSSIRALVLVDREAMEDHGGIPGLLMFGAPQHLRPPYYSEELNDSPGARSGSATETLFRWLQDAREALEDRPRSDLDSLRDDLSNIDADAASTMYHLFARDDWMHNPRFPQLLNPVSAEGIAQATHIAAADHLTIVMATPLYVRARSMLPSTLGAIGLQDNAPRCRLSRLTHRHGNQTADGESTHAPVGIVRQSRLPLDETRWIGRAPLPVHRDD